MVECNILVWFEWMSTVPLHTCIWLHTFVWMRSMSNERIFSLDVCLYRVVACNQQHLHSYLSCVCILIDNMIFTSLHVNDIKQLFGSYRWPKLSNLLLCVSSFEAFNYKKEIEWHQTVVWEDSIQLLLCPLTNQLSEREREREREREDMDCIEFHASLDQSTLHHPWWMW